MKGNKMIVVKKKVEKPQLFAPRGQSFIAPL